MAQILPARANQGFQQLVKRMDEKKGRSRGFSQIGRISSKGKRHGFCHHKVACPFLLLSVRLESLHPVRTKNL
jgi:hypothetical protein